MIIQSIVESDFNSMSDIIRYSGTKCLSPEKLSEHNNYVIMLSDIIMNYIIHEQINKIGNKDFSLDKYKVLSYAIYHDYEEIYTGDITTPVKNHSKKFKKELEELGHKLMINGLGENFKDENKTISDHILDCHSNYEEYKYEKLENKIVKFSDMLQAYIFSLNEINSGNRRFYKIRRNIYLDIIQKFSGDKHFKSLLDSFTVFEKGLNLKYNENIGMKGLFQISFKKLKVLFTGE